MSAPPIYYGNATIEERIVVADVVAHVRVVTVQASAERHDVRADDGGTTPEADQPYVGALKFTFDVVEYLESGDNPPNRLTAMVGSLEPFDTMQEAMTEANNMLVERNAQWDSREAIVFLMNESKGYPATASNDLYFMSLLDLRVGFWDMYSISSYRNRIWLPATSPANAQVAGELRFYLEEPDASESQTSASGRSTQSASQSSSITQTIGLSALKAKISEIDGMIVDDSRKHEICMINKFSRMRRWTHLRSEGIEPKVTFTKSARIKSGQPAGTVVLKGANDTKIADGWEGRDWFEGEGAELFARGSITGTRTETATISNSFYAMGGKLLVQAQHFMRSWETVRPLPKGTYNLRWKFQHALHAPCDNEDTIYDFPTTIRVTAPTGVLHEALFDPVTDGSAVAADSSNGQLEPAAFTDGNGASATIQRIEWASDAVKVKVSPHTGLAGHKLDIIELDGEVSLSLQVDNATVDATNGSLGWAVAEQPWEDGDLLMLRIKEILPEIALEGVPSTIRSGQSAPFTVHATGLSSSLRYTIRLSTDNDHLGFRDGCGTPYRTVSLPSNSTSHSLTDTLHGCAISSGTLSASLMQGATTVHSSTADVQVEQSINVTLTLSPREDGNVTRTDLTIEWTDPGNCDGNYFVGLYNSDGVVLRNLGHHSASETSMLQVELPTPWEDIPNDERSVRVTCAPNAGNWRIVGEVPLRSGLP